jgi:general secretion pathway protein I
MRTRPTTSLRPGRARRCSGFTLLELLVAFVVLAFGIVGVLRAVSTGLLAARDAGDYTTAATLAEMQLAQLRWDENLQSDGESEGDFGDLYPDYKWAAMMEPVELPDLEESGLQRVELTVTWEHGKREHHLTVETCLRESDFESASQEEQL